MAYGKKMAYFQAPMPLCKEEDLPYFFYQMVDYFDNVLHKPFYISLADAEAVEYLNLDPEKFEVTELDDLKDYLYDGKCHAYTGWKRSFIRRKTA